MAEAGRHQQHDLTRRCSAARMIGWCASIARSSSEGLTSPKSSDSTTTTRCDAAWPASAHGSRAVARSEAASTASCSGAPDRTRILHVSGPETSATTGGAPGTRASPAATASSSKSARVLLLYDAKLSRFRSGPAVEHAVGASGEPGPGSAWSPSSARNAAFSASTGQERAAVGEPERPSALVQATHPAVKVVGPFAAQRRRTHRARHQSRQPAHRLAPPINLRTLLG